MHLVPGKLYKMKKGYAREKFLNNGTSHWNGTLEDGTFVTVCVDDVLLFTGYTEGLGEKLLGFIARDQIVYSAIPRPPQSSLKEILEQVSK